VLLTSYVYSVYVYLLHDCCVVCWVQVGKKIISGKPSLAVIGDLAKTPYLDELI